MKHIFKAKSIILFYYYYDHKNEQLNKNVIFIQSWLDLSIHIFIVFFSPKTLKLRRNWQNIVIYILYLLLLFLNAFAIFLRSPKKLHSFAKNSCPFRDTIHLTIGHAIKIVINLSSIFKRIHGSRYPSIQINKKINSGFVKKFIYIFNSYIY